MVIDYRERKPVNKNRPRRHPIGTFVLMGALALLGAYGAGFGTGWLFFRKGAARPAAAPVAIPQAKGTTAAPAQSPQTAPPTADPPLTFYDTLPKGSKALIGSGLNPVKPEGGAPAPVAKSAAPATPPGPANGKAGGTVPTAEKGRPAGTFTVQVASYKDRKEADAVREKIAALGFPAYVVESHVKDKGVWYRVRIGRHLERKAAAELARKAGKGALVVPE